MTNSFLLTFNSTHFQEYLQKKKVFSFDDLKTFLISISGNQIVGISKALKNTASEDDLFSLFSDNFNSLSDLIFYLKRGFTIDDKNICVCGKEKLTRLKFCSKSCSLSNRDPEIRKQLGKEYSENWKLKTEQEKENIKRARIKGVKDKYGVDHNWKIPGAQKKKEETFLKKYGYKVPSKNLNVKKKMIMTNQERYGHNSPLQNEDVKAKCVITSLENWNVPNPMQSRIVQDKVLKASRMTYLRKYGSENPYDDEEFMTQWLLKFNDSIHKSFIFKEYEFPSGRIIKVQGYENFLLDFLVEHFSEDEIIVNYEIIKTVGIIKYVDEHGKTRNYIPDILLDNIIYEVKSEWTYKNNIENTWKKGEGCELAGFTFILCIVDNDKKLNFYENKKNCIY